MNVKYLMKLIDEATYVYQLDQIEEDVCKNADQFSNDDYINLISEIDDKRWTLS